MRDDLTSGRDMPWQVRAIGIFGVPSAIALYLVYTLASDIRPLTAAVERVAVQMEATNVAMVRALAQTQSEYLALRRILTAQCINASQSNEDRRRCLE